MEVTDRAATVVGAAEPVILRAGRDVLAEVTTAGVHHRVASWGRHHVLNSIEEHS